jgi:hypothetical protein
MGRVSREARLLFILLWTVADDAGRLRAAPRLLAGLLYPFDDDASALLPRWLDELEQEGCIYRYQHDVTHYLEIVKWRDHQKIDKPTPSRLPDPSRESSEAFANIREASATPRERSATDLGPGTLEGDLGPRAKEVEPSALRAALDLRAELFNRGLEILARITGRTPDSCRSLIGRWLKLTDDEAVHVLAAIEDAERNRVADPTAWITARLKSLNRTQPPLSGHRSVPRPGSREDRQERTANVVAQLDQYLENCTNDQGRGSETPQATDGLLPVPKSA